MVDLTAYLESLLWPLDYPRKSIPVGGHKPPGNPPDYVPALQAAVLVPIVLRGSGPTVLFTHRSEKLSSHAGQVSFPGGRVESGDRDATAAALRETREEVGIPEDRIRPVGLLDFYDTITNYRVLPVVGLVDEAVKIVVDKREVIAVFEVPLEELCRLDHYVRHSITRGGRNYHYFSYRHKDHLIWGATAQMLRGLVKRIRRSADALPPELAAVIR